MNNQEIIDNKPKGEDDYFVDITGEYFDEFGNHLNSKGLWSDSDTSPVSPRSLADIKRIVELEKELSSLVRGIKDLGSISYDQFPDTKTAENILQEHKAGRGFL
jgi:hypothetical protein